MKMRTVIPFVVGLVVLFCGTSVAANSRLPCSDKDAMEAEKAVDYLRTWKDLHISYLKYSACDDGAIAEGWSDFVVSTLSHRWSTLGDLEALIKHDKNYEQFILRHIDATTDEKDLSNIVTHASKDCPGGFEELCSKIGKAAMDAFKEL
jgi:hypothetical protein